MSSLLVGFFQQLRVQSRVQKRFAPVSQFFSTTTHRRGLDEFFEEEKMRGEDKIRVGRAWKPDELRLKSNSDLHKLWFVLLKERNMLLTMEAAYQDKYVAMPNPERKDKVEESMENLEEVVKERNRAYYQLEVGITGERDRFFRRDALGRIVPYKPVEHALPAIVNAPYRRFLRHKYGCSMNPYVQEFLGKYQEKINRRENHKVLMEMRDAAKIVRRFPDVNIEALQERFPLLDPARLMRWKNIRGHNNKNQNV
ncbi:39S ribosomal protein L47, mitochondrial [Eurytemora carolleeae]|uniref:39S ribosomal protein L47, mitochondrial n=1 Tax=Eurytemora carolleeae TaxID=1294199 RepID=UPI000C781DF4|nr:39S ribosomal protein L47, mitochondrial [Eurytemora carolleeae]|eukprot:XP_023333162.1 39S ribosomal protein L47, mitochondrial-like [Eurytemora affinis]